MEPEPSKLEVRPPALVDAVIRLLIPPACREHVLGDLWERYTSPRQYVVDALRTLPFVIWSQIRRTSDPLLLAMQVLAAFVFFGGLAGQPGPDGGPVWLRAVVPAIAVAVAMVVRDAYCWPKFPSSRQAALDAGLAVASAFASQGALAMVWPELTLAPREALMGGFGTFLAVFSLRTAAPPKTGFRSLLSANGSLSVDNFVRDAQEFERRIRQRNRREILAGVLVILGFGAGVWRGPNLVARVGCALVMAGALFIIYRLRTRAVVGSIPLDAPRAHAIAAYRRELEVQRDLLRTVTSWYLLPLLPGMAVLTLGQTLALAQPAPPLRVLVSFLLFGVLTRQLNRRGARKLQDKIDELVTLETQDGREGDDRR
jgi:hypothetical protein